MYVMHFAGGSARLPIQRQSIVGKKPSLRVAVGHDVGAPQEAIVGTRANVERLASVGVTYAAKESLLNKEFVHWGRIA